MMSKMTERDRRALTMLGWAAGGILGFVLIASPVMDQWDKKQSELNKHKRTLTDADQNVNDVLAARKATLELRKRAHVVATDDLLNAQTSRMLRQVQSLGSYRRLVVHRLEGMPLRQEEKYHRSGVSLQFGGTLRDLHALMREMRNASPSLRVERFSLASDGKDPRKIEGQMVVSAYAVVLADGGKRK
jgi:Tfp pilus assembly protein PilO